MMLFHEKGLAIRKPGLGGDTLSKHNKNTQTRFNQEPASRELTDKQCVYYKRDHVFLLSSTLSPHCNNAEKQMTISVGNRLSANRK